MTSSFYLLEKAATDLTSRTLMPPLMDEPEGPSFNPYLNARREWNERYGSYIKAARQWKFTAWGALGLSLVLAIGLAVSASQNKLVPYVVAVDKLGSAVAVKRADVPSRPDERVIKAQLARWILNMRSVYVDMAAARQSVYEAYAMINRRGPAYATANEYFKKNAPLLRAQSETVTVEIVSVLPITENTWRVEWQEDTRRRDGVSFGTQQWQAAITTQITPPRDEATLLANPVGLYVESFNWSPRL